MLNYTPKKAASLLQRKFNEQQRLRLIEKSLRLSIGTRENIFYVVAVII